MGSGETGRLSHAARRLQRAAGWLVCLASLACTPPPPPPIPPAVALTEPAKVWAAARANRPTDTRFALGVDLAALQRTQLFAEAYPRLIDKLRVRGAIDAIKQVCQIDVLDAVHALVAMSSSDGANGAIYLAISGLGRARVGDCAQRLVQIVAGADTRISLTQTAHLTEVSDGKTTRYLGWVGTDVLVIAIRNDDKPALLKWMGGTAAGATSELDSITAKVDTAAAVWAAANETKQLESGARLKGGYGTIRVANGGIDIDVHAMMGDAAEATSLATTSRGAFDAFREGMQGPSPQLAAVLAPVSLVADHSDVVVQAHFVEQALIDNHVVMLLGLMGILN